MHIEQQAQDEALKTQQEAASEAASRTLDPRMSAMDRIAEASQKARDGLGEETQQEPGLAEAQETEAEDTSAGEQIAQAQGDDTTNEGEALPGQDAQTFRVKVDGVESEVDLHTLKQGFQANQSASRRFREASELAKQAEQKMRQLAAWEAELKQRAEQSPATPEEAVNAPSGSGEDDPIRALAEAIYDGDPDQLVERLKVITPKVDREEIMRQATERAVAQLRQEQAQERFQQELGAAQNRFSQEYADLDANPILRDRVDQLTYVLADSMKSASPWEIIDAAASTVRTEAMSAGIPVGDKQDSRVESKRRMASNAPVNPASLSAHGSVGHDPAPPPTRQQTLQEMAQARGQII